MNAKKLIIVGLVLVALAFALAACSPATTEATPCPTAEPCPTCPEAPACPECPECPTPVVETVPYQELWVASGHNDVAAEAFRHWDGDDPAEVPTSCARCHSTAGYVDFLGSDGSEAGKVDAAVPAAEAQGIQCIACHDPAANNMTGVAFPGKDEEGNAILVEGLGDATRCLVCHQGRASKASIDGAIEKFAVEDMDAVVAPIKNADGSESKFGFVNIHYFAAAATLFGTEVKGGYEYEGMVYDGQFRHVEGYDTCVGCHDPHSLQIKIENCAECHEGVTTVEDLKGLRMVSSTGDYDGDGDKEEGIAEEIAGLQEALLAAIQDYALNTAGAEIKYDAATYPYFLGADDAAYPNWTARLLKAAYNYQVSIKDPGAFAHGGKYIIELLHDSLADLGVDVSAMDREDAGHFAGNTEAFRHWDAEGEVPGGCARCHSADGLPTFVKNGVNIATETANGFMCSTCHNTAAFPELLAVNTVTFPSGKSVGFGEAEPSNLCLACHQGRESKSTVDRAIGAFADAPDAVALKADGTPALSFRNVHYFAAGATLFGNDVQGAYVYADKEYAGQAQHPLAKCSDCHDVHALDVKAAACEGCHPGVELDGIRMPTTPDYDGDGDTAEGVKGELDGLAEKLFEALQAYAETNAVGIAYDSHAYPYFFEADGTTRFTKWTPRLLKAAYNYQYYQKDPGAFAHNPAFVAQFLIDSIEDLGGDVSTFTRP